MYRTTAMRLRYSTCAFLITTMVLITFKSQLRTLFDETELTTVIVVYSPTLAQIVMGLITMGTNGTTARELQYAFTLPENKTELMEMSKGLMSQYNGDFQLDIVTKLYYKENLQVLPEFLIKARTYFGADVGALDLTKPQKAANAINQWISQKTHQNIQNFTKPEELDNNSSVILVNAMSLKARWASEFSINETMHVDFVETSKRKVSIPMMHKVDTFGYADIAEYQIKVLQLPYKDTDISMLLLLPYELNGLKAMENYDLMSLLELLRPERVQVKLPKFQIKPEMIVEAALEKLSCNEIFRNNGELSEIFQNETTKVSSIITKIYFDVNEAGSLSKPLQLHEIYTRNKSFSQQSNLKEFTVDHPFMFVILSPNNIYFMGYVLQMKSPHKNNQN